MCTQRVRRNRLDTGHGTRAGVRTANIAYMVVTLDVSKLSGWLNADADCRVTPRHLEGERGLGGARRGRVAAVAVHAAYTEEPTGHWA